VHEPDAAAEAPVVDEFRTETNREHDERKESEEDAVRAADEAREAGPREPVPAPPSPRPATAPSPNPAPSGAAARSGGVAPYWKRRDVEVQTRSRTLLGRELLK
jgi:hypothetical protein